jgi:O-acetyl-ADP-ribose deacetylase (regulator of RNase III)
VFFQVDVIVNSSNIRLKLDKGAVSLSVLEKGGRSILDECRERFPRGIDYGEVVCTQPGKMNFKFICHGALPHWTPTAKYSIKVCIYLIEIKHFHIF